MATSRPTVRQRELGKRLRELRLDHGFTVEEVAAEIMCSATKISRLETGIRRPSLRDVKDLCALYKVDKSTADELMTIAREAREQEWWTQFEDLNLDPYLGLEEVASAITSYTMYYIPALLQIEDYTRVIIETIAPRMDPKILEQRVAVRMRRQKRLEEADKPRYRVLLDEAVLYRSVGGPAIMAAQLDKVLEAERQNRVTPQIVPFDLGAHAAQDSNFILFEFDQNSSSFPTDEKPKLSPIVFVEALTGNHYLEKELDIERYREAVEYLRDTALSPRDSVQRLTEIREIYVSGRHPASVGAASTIEERRDKMAEPTAPASPAWRVSQTCDGGACVMVARDGEFILLGNTTQPDSPKLSYTRAEFKEFATGIKRGDFDDLL